MIRLKVCHLFGTETLPEPMLTYYQLQHYEQSKLKIFIDQNAFVNVFEMAAILSWSHYVKWLT